MPDLIKRESHSSDVIVVEAHSEVIDIGCFKLINSTKSVWKQNKFNLRWIFWPSNIPWFEKLSTHYFLSLSFWQIRTLIKSQADSYLQDSESGILKASARKMAILQGMAEKVTLEKFEKEAAFYTKTEKLSRYYFRMCTTLFFLPKCKSILLITRWVEVNKSGIIYTI